MQSANPAKNEEQTKGFARLGLRPGYAITNWIIMGAVRVFNAG